MGTSVTGTASVALLAKRRRSPFAAASGRNVSASEVFKFSATLCAAARPAQQRIVSTARANRLIFVILQVLAGVGRAPEIGHPFTVNNQRRGCPCSFLRGAGQTARCRAISGTYPWGEVARG